jgi:hypothetical protein
MRAKYKLPGFGYGVDGVLIVFEEKPRNIPENRFAQQFFSRKMKYAINAQVIGGPDGLIYDLNLGSPGRFADATTFRCSAVKPILEGHIPFYKLAGDSGYAKSRMLITPYRTPEAQGKGILCFHRD